MASVDKPLEALKPTAELAALKAKKWPPEGKAERIARATEAWRNRPKPAFTLTAAQWRIIAEDPDVAEE